MDYKSINGEIGRMSTMEGMTPEKIASACGGVLHCRQEDRQREIAGAVIDSRKVEYNFLFFAVKGERADGHQFIGQVYDQGALLVVCEKEPELDYKQRNYILVENTLTALREIAAYYRSCLSTIIVGITGSVGKTTTKEFIASVASKQYKVLKTEGNFNNEIGLPLTIFKIRKEHEVAVLEMGINHFGEMSRLSGIAKPDISVITNIGQCHLEFLGSREGILAAKSEMFEHMNDSGYICLNGDDDMLDTIKEVKNCTLIRYGLDKKNELYAEDFVARGLLGSSCTLHTKGTSLAIQIPLSGKHMVYNALAATTVGEILKISYDNIAAGIKEVKSLSGRNNIISSGKYIIIDDCYNANPVSMKAAIDLLSIAEGRKVAILGDMGELGDHVAALHREIGFYAVEQKIDQLICIGENASDIYAAAGEITESGGHKIERFYFKNSEEMLAKKKELLKDGDNILVKASHFMEFDQIVEDLMQ